MAKNVISIKDNCNYILTLCCLPLAEIVLMCIQVQFSVLFIWLKLDPVPAVFEKVKNLLAVLETAPLSEQLSGRSRQLLLSAGSLHMQITSASES